MKNLSDWLKYLEESSRKTPRSELNELMAIAKKCDLYSHFYSDTTINEKKTRVITIAGTNGKGSCTEMLTSVYVDAGYRVGTYTSPHLFEFNERIRIQKKPVDDECIIDAFKIIDQARGDLALTYFEFITLSALWIFKQANLDVILLEVGIGGRLDATNIVDADLALITSIGLDHQHYLGDTREAIAQEKAGIFRPNQLAVCGEISPPKTLIDVAEKLDTHVSTIKKWIKLDSHVSKLDSHVSKQDIHVSKLDSHVSKQDIHVLPTGNFAYSQHKDGWDFMSYGIHLKNLPLPILYVHNAATVLQAVLLLNHLLPVCTDIHKVIQSIVNTFLPARCEIKKLPNGAAIIFDVAHNPQAVSRLSDFIQAYKLKVKPKKISAIFSMFSDKDIESVLQTIKGEIDEWHTAEINMPRRASKQQLKKAFSAQGILPVWHEHLSDLPSWIEKNSISENLKDRAKGNVKNNIRDNVKKDLWVVFGSFSVVAEVFAACKI